MSSGTPRTSPFFTGVDCRQRHPVIPIFFPFLGCRSRCIFCAQSIQTGQSEPSADDIAKRLDQAVQWGFLHNGIVEIAFYGGTFTCWPRQLQMICLKALQCLQTSDRELRIRCSTRPDALDPEWLCQLKSAGLSTIELGIQSFSDAALKASGRGYERAKAIAGCRSVRRAGFGLGVQLMPGMPGGDVETFLQDVALSLELGAVFLRFYPCLVFEGTPLAALWRAGRYVPWDLDTTIRALGTALSMAWKARVPVIRMGVAPCAEMTDAHLAGPWHPCLGSLVQGEALLQTVATLRKEAGREIVCLTLPLACRGFMWGIHGSLRPRWAQLGVYPENVFWDHAEQGVLRFC